MHAFSINTNEVIRIRGSGKRAEDSGNHVACARAHIDHTEAAHIRAGQQVSECLTIAGPDNLPHVSIRNRMERDVFSVREGKHVQFVFFRKPVCHLVSAG